MKNRIGELENIIEEFGKQGKSESGTNKVTQEIIGT